MKIIGSSAFGGLGQMRSLMIREIAWVVASHVKSAKVERRAARVRRRVGSSCPLCHRLILPERFAEIRAPQKTIAPGALGEAL